MLSINIYEKSTVHLPSYIISMTINGKSIVKLFGVFIERIHKCCTWEKL